MLLVNFIDKSDDGTFYGLKRETLGFFGKNQTTGEIIYPLHYK